MELLRQRHPKNPLPYLQAVNYWVYHSIVFAPPMLIKKAERKHLYAVSLCTMKGSHKIMLLHKIVFHLKTPTKTERLR